MEKYLYNPVSSLISTFTQIRFNGTSTLAPDNLNWVIKLSDNLDRLINMNSNILFTISDYLIEHQNEIREAYKEKMRTHKFDIYNLIPPILVSFSLDKKNSNSIDLSEEISKFPLTLEDQTRKILHNLESIQTGLSLNISDPSKYRNIFYCKDNFQPYSILKVLVANGYLKPIDENNKEYVLTPEGKAKSQNVQKKQTLKTAFIAMSFSAQPHKGTPDDDLAQIRIAFKLGIKRAGYEPIVIDEVKHTNYIPSEIDRQIENSSFLVEDLTYKNDGAIHEAGFAEGKGIPVIRCIRKSEFDNPQTIPHFDYRQRNMIIWTTYEELSQKLEELIKGAIGTT